MLRWALEVNGGSCKIVCCNSACALMVCIEPYLTQRSYPLHTVSSPESVKLFPIDYFVRTQCQLSVPVLISNISRVSTIRHSTVGFVILPIGFLTVGRTILSSTTPATHIYRRRMPTDDTAGIGGSWITTRHVRSRIGRATNDCGTGVFMYH